MAIQISGTGSYLPPCVVTNDDLATIVETNDEWIRSRSGIESRHYSAGEPTWAMAVAAARAAASEIDPRTIGLIVTTTVTPDYITPTTSNIVQTEIGAEHAFCMDINAGCTGFIYALDVAAAYMEARQVDTALVIGAETLTKLTNFSDRATCVLFGDGAGAVLLTRHKVGASGFFGRHFGATGDGAESLVGEAYAVNHPFLSRPVDAKRFLHHTAGQHLSMAGREVYKFAVSVLPEAVEKAVAAAGWTLDDVDLIVPHQANARIVNAAARRLGVDDHVMVDAIATIGNTSSATVPIVFDQLVREGRVKRGMRLVFAGFGGGLSYGAVALVY